MPDGSSLILGNARRNTATTATTLAVQGDSGIRIEASGFAAITARGSSRGVSGAARASDGIAVQGQARNSSDNGFGSGVGVLGHSGSGFGVFGYSESGSGAGGASVTGYGVHGSGGAGGVLGYNWANAPGVTGVSQMRGTGVQGRAGAIGVYGECPNPTGFGIVGENPRGYSAAFYGPVLVEGDFAVTGAKAAAIRLRDGSCRLLYSVESPESWFEDFGEAALVNGRVRIPLARDFVSVIKSGGYHVFLTALGKSSGLYVATRTRGYFEVREQNGAKSRVRFSYRIVARRKDVRAQRARRVKLPRKPTVPSLPTRAHATRPGKAPRMTPARPAKSGRS